MELTYLIGGPEGFGSCCDILLRLDDGTELPAHTQILARHSEMFCNMLQDDGGALISASALKRIVVPMIDCSRDTAIAFLSAVYSSQLNTERMDETCTQDILGRCDDAMSCLTGPNLGGVSDYLVELPHDTFLNMLDSALKLDMPKLQACCEHHIAMHPCGHFTALELAQHLPPDSALRIGDATRKAFLDLQAQLLESVQKKDCSYSTTALGTSYAMYQQEYASCQAFIAKAKCDDLSKYIPPPMVFLEMAKPPAKICKPRCS